MKKATRLVSLLLCMVMLFSVTSAFAVEFNDPGTFPICKEPVHFTIGIPKSTTVLDWDTNYMTGEVEKDVNCEITWVEMGADNADMKQKVELMVMAGGNDFAPGHALETMSDIGRTAYRDIVGK